MQRIHRTMAACRMGWPVLLCFASVPVPAVAQVPAQAESGWHGFSVRQVSVFSSYYSVNMPQVAGTPGFRASDTSLGGLAIFAYTKSSERNRLALQYTPSYTARLRYSEARAMGNAVTLQFDRSMTSRLRFVLSGTGAIRNREEFQFGQFAVAAAAGATADQLPEDPAAQSLFFGSRVLSANVRTGFEYLFSPRLSLMFGAAGMRMQYLQNESRRQSQPGTSGLIPQVTAVSGDVGASYLLSPRTTIGGRFESRRQQSRLQNTLITSGYMSVDRVLTQRWSVYGHGGVGQYRMLQQSAAGFGSLQYIAGAGTTYRRYAHSFTAAFSQQVADIYGIGASSSRSMNGIWRWAPPTARFWLTASFGRTQLRGEVFSASTWRGTAEAGRRIKGNIGIFGAYAYLGYSSLLVPGDAMISQNAFRFGLTWMPQSQTAMTR